MSYEPLYTAEEMRAAEAAYPGPTLELMERAGQAVAEEVLRRFPDARRIGVWCGTGANGGDGLLAAAELARAGKECAVRLLGDEDRIEGDAAAMLARAKEAGVPFLEDVAEADVAVDALFGTGFGGAPRPPAARAIAELNAGGAPVVAVDLPSGVDASTGRVEGAAVQAAATVTFHGAKVGHAVAPGRFHAGELVVADIGLAPAPTRNRRATGGILDLVPRRSERDNKYTAGSVLVVGGSLGLTGAPSLTSEAALRAGAGIVTACVPASLNLVFEQRLVEVMTRPCADEDGVMTPEAADEILEAAGRAGAVALGPGLGRTEGSRALAGFLLDRLDVPVVLDADGLWALAGHLDWVFSREAPTVLTPHAGELGRLLGRSSDEVGAHRLAAAREAAAIARCVVVLKGDDTIVVDGSADEPAVAINVVSAPGLATAGTGDVLAGTIGALLARGLDPFAAACCAVRANTTAGVLAADRIGAAESVIAGDVIEALPEALRP
jgi:NAD(P)H-hydrate epimerase